MTGHKPTPRLYPRLAPTKPTREAGRIAPSKARPRRKGLDDKMDMKTARQRAYSPHTFHGHALKPAYGLQRMGRGRAWDVVFKGTPWGFGRSTDADARRFRVF